MFREWGQVYLLSRFVIRRISSSLLIFFPEVVLVKTLKRDLSSAEDLKCLATTGKGADVVLFISLRLKNIL